MTEPIRLLIADDQARTRQSLRAWLSSRLPLGDVFEAESGREAVRCVERQAPDLVVMDARMADGDGIEATRTIKECCPGVKVLVLSLYPSYREAAIAAGADAFLTKDEQPERLLSTLTALLS